MAALPPVHARFDVEGNLFEMRKGTVLGAKGVGSVSFSNNQIIKLGEQANGKATLWLEACEQVRIAGNRFEEEGRIAAITWRRMNPHQITLDSGQPFEVVSSEMGME